MPRFSSSVTVFQMHTRWHLSLSPSHTFYFSFWWWWCFGWPICCAPSFSPEKNTIFETFLLHSTVLQSMCIEHLSVVQFQMHSTCWALFFIAVCRCVGRRIQTVHIKHTQRVKHKQQFNVLCDGERFGASGGRLRETRLFFARWLAPGSTDRVKVTAADCSRRRHRWLLLLSYGPSAVHVLMLGVGSGGLWLHS